MRSRKQIRASRYDPDDPRVDTAAPDRHFSAGVLSLIEELVEEDVRQGWDAPPTFGFLFQRGRTPMQPGMSFHGMMFEWSPLPEATRALIRARRPHHVVLHMAETYRRTPEHERPLPPGNLVAVGFMHEAWMVTPRTDDAAAVQEAMQAARDRKVAEHPDRVEVKTVSAVDINGVRYSIFRPRSREHEGLASASVAGSQGLQLGGDVVTSLHYLIEILQGHTVPDWPEFSRQYDPLDDLDPEANPQG